MPRVGLWFWAPSRATNQKASVVVLRAARTLSPLPFLARKTIAARDLSGFCDFSSFKWSRVGEGSLKGDKGVLLSVEEGWIKEL